MSEPTIEIFCAEESHASRIAEIGRFERVKDGWSFIPRMPKRPHRLLQVRQASIHYRPEDVERDAVRTPAGTPIGLPSSALTFTLRCPLCGLNETRRHDGLAPILDRLSAAAQPRVSLAGLQHLASGWAQGQ